MRACRDTKCLSANKHTDQSIRDHGVGETARDPSCVRGETRFQILVKRWCNTVWSGSPLSSLDNGVGDTGWSDWCGVERVEIRSGPGGWRSLSQMG